MSAQSEHMKGVVAELIALVRGRVNHNGNGSQPEDSPGQRREPLPPPQEEIHGRSPFEPEGDQVDPEKIIPMDDDFQDF